jgi:hypothetical protein
MEESKNVQDTKEATSYKITYCPIGAFSQVGAQTNHNREFIISNLEEAIEIYNQLNNPESLLTRDVRPHPLSIELYKVYTCETKMINPNA